MKEALELLYELKEDNTLPRNVKIKIEKIKEILEANLEPEIKANKVLQEIEEISEETNLDVITRTKIYTLASVLGKLS